MANYDTLMAEVNAKKAAAISSISALQSAKASFSCNVENPKNAAGSYVGAVNTANGAVRDYRDSLKKLVVAVKTAAEKAKQ